MSFTYERKIDALGGARGEESQDWHDGYSKAVELATEIGADADEMIAELMETIDAVLDPSGYQTLKRWTEDAETLLRRIRARQA